jgi:hypothetical protein
LQLESSAITAALWFIPSVSTVSYFHVTGFKLRVLVGDRELLLACRLTFTKLFVERELGDAVRGGVLTESSSYGGFTFGGVTGSSAARL